MKTRDPLSQKEPCNKTFSCCYELYENEKHFGASRDVDCWKELRCSFKFGGEACGASKPTRNEIRIYNLLLEERRSRLAESNQLREEIARLEAECS